MSAVVADHTSDDSYIYQLSLVLATATLSHIYYTYPAVPCKVVT